MILELTGCAGVGKSTLVSAIDHGLGEEGRSIVCLAKPEAARRHLTLWQAGFRSLGPPSRTHGTMKVSDLKSIVARYGFGRCGWMYLLLKKMYWFCWYKLMKLSRQSTTVFREKEYSQGIVQTMNIAWINHKSKKLFCDRICQELPFESLCEVGCGAGVNFVLLAKECPTSTHLCGVDINKSSVNYGNEYFAQEGIQNVKLMYGKVEAMDFVEDKSFDIVVTNALLCLMDPEYINVATKELIRIARRKLILFELNYAEATMGIFRDGYWVRDYERYFISLCYNNVSVSIMPKDTWESTVWKKYGAIVTVNL